MPGATALGKPLGAAAARHPGLSGFRLLADGSDGLLLRAQMIRAAERSLDIQYYMFAEDDTGKLLQQSILRAADRGVRVRILIDDTNSFDQPRWKMTLSTLNEHPRIEIRMFNPFAYRGEVPALHFIDAALNAPRMNRRMHNKLLVADNALAIVGGRNIADQYYGSGTRPVPLFGIPLGELPIRFGDFDVAAAGPIVPQLSQTFDTYWNSALSIPRQALEAVDTAPKTLPDARATLETKATAGELREVERRLKRRSAGGSAVGSIAVDLGAGDGCGRSARKSGSAARREGAFAGRSGAGRSNPRNPARSRHRVALLRPRGSRAADSGGGAAAKRPRSHSHQFARIDRRPARAQRLSQVSQAVDGVGRRALRDPCRAGPAARGLAGASGSRSRQRERSSGSGSDAPFALHAKLYVYDVQRVFIGSANFDRRSFKVNTELGLMIESPEIARQIVDRFDRFASLSNSYQPRARTRWTVRAAPALAHRAGRRRGRPRRRPADHILAPRRGRSVFDAADRRACSEASPFRSRRAKHERRPKSPFFPTQATNARALFLRRLRCICRGSARRTGQRRRWRGGGRRGGEARTHLRRDVLPFAFCSAM